MKYVVLSYNVPGGVLAVHRTQIIANWISNGVQDTYIKIINSHNCKEYELFNQEWISNNHISLEEGKTSITYLKNLNQEFINDKQLINYRFKLFESLGFWSTGLHGRTNKFFINEFPILASVAVKNSDPISERWHHWIIDHASIHNLTPVESYRELKLISDSECDFRFRAGSFIEKWVSTINQTNLIDFIESEIDRDLLQQMRTEFFLVKKI